MKRALLIVVEVLGIALCLALGFGVIVLMAEGAGMDNTARPDHPYCEHAP